MAGVGIAQIGRHRHDGGIAVGQASSGFLHSFSLKQAIDAVVEQNAEASAASRQSYGGTAPVNVRRMAAEWRERLA